MTDLFRVSFSILDPWSRGDYDEAVKRWMRIETPPTQAMIDGQLLHRQWQEETTITKSLPSVFGGKSLENPLPEVKLECVLDDWIQFVGIIDCYEDGIVHEYKTGRSDSLRWARTMQTKCYDVLARSNGMSPKYAIIHHYNQHTKQITESKVYYSEYTRQLAREWIRTYASELKEALVRSGEL